MMRFVTSVQFEVLHLDPKSDGILAYVIVRLIHFHTYNVDRCPCF